MRPRLQCYLLLFAACAVLLCGDACAQVPADHMLPDAPSVVRRISTEPGHIVEFRSSAAVATGQLQPSFSTSLNAREKYALAYHRIVSPQMPLKAVFISGFELAAGTGPDLPTNGWGAFGKRVGYNALGISTTTFLNTAFVPALVHQDPRYFALGEGTAKARVMWAIRSEFVGVRDDGHAMPNYANLVGLALASAVANLYLPRPSTGFDHVAEGYAIKLGVGTGLNVAREFGVYDRIKAIARHSKKADQ